MAARLTPTAPGESPSGRRRADAEGRGSHALRLLEWDTVLSEVARRTTSEPGAAHVRALRPSRDRAAAEEGLALVEEMRSLLHRTPDWNPPLVPDAEPALRRLGVEGSVLDAEALRTIGVLLASALQARAALRRHSDELPRLAKLGERMLRARELQERIAGSFDASGGVADSASPELQRVRRSLRSARSALVRRLESFVRDLPARLQVPDASVTVRSGRYCVPIRREGVSDVGGIVHDESATHRTLFIEPPLAIGPMNRVAELEREEAREVQRVLRELTAAARPQAGDLVLSLAALAEADSLFGRAQYALEHGGARPAFADPPAGEPAGATVVRLVAARHPLLLAGGEPPVPFELEMRDPERVLLVSGPNAGGKTVLLKTLGVTALMAQSGIVPPVGVDTRLPFFRSFFAVIGDEQSIEASLSTFTAQMDGVREALERADLDSLVLLDELGGNTDPAEGAALAGAVLGRLAGQAGLTVATTHLGALKEIAAADPRVVNASLQFDTRALRPTFRLLRDRPGRSYALEIASRLGLPTDVLEDARGRLGDEEQRVERLLAELEEREQELAGLLGRARTDERELRAREAELEKEEARLGRSARELDREGATRAERWLLEARREVAEIVDRLRDEYAELLESRDAGHAPVSREAADAVAGRARADVERLLHATRRRTPAPPESPRPPDDLAPGSSARSRSLGVRGRIAEVRDEEVVLEASGLRFTVPLGDLVPVEEGEGVRTRPARPATRPLPELDAHSEVNLRGLRVDEVEGVLLPALDAAIVADLPSLKIIHGKGTGALRDEVARLLRGDRRVASARPGGFEEGGSGVTVVELRGGSR